MIKINSKTINNESCLNNLLLSENNKNVNYIKNTASSNEMDIEAYYLVCGATEKEKTIFNKNNSEFMKSYIYKD